MVSLSVLLAGRSFDVAHELVPDEACDLVSTSEPSPCSRAADAGASKLTMQQTLPLFALNFLSIQNTLNRLKPQSRMRLRDRRSSGSI